MGEIIPDDIFVLTILRDDFKKHRIDIQRIVDFAKTKDFEIENRISNILQDLVERKLVNTNAIVEYWINGNGEKYLREYEEKIEKISVLLIDKKQDRAALNKWIAMVTIYLLDHEH